MKGSGLLPPLLAIAGIHFLSSLEPDELGVPVLPFPHADKAVHATLFGILLLSFRGWRGWRRPVDRWLPGAVAASLVVAMGDELHQRLVPGRMSDPLDLLADAAGIAFIALLCLRLADCRLAS